MCKHKETHFSPFQALRDVGKKSYMIHMYET